LSLPLNSSYLDVGAHYGDTVLTLALYASTHGRPDLRFIAFEPNSSKCKIIYQIAKMNKLHIKIINSCVGDKVGKVINDNQAPSFSGACSFREITDEAKATCRSPLGLSDGFDMFPLDKFINEIEPVGLIHIDTEGWETKVLQGAKKILSRNNLILIMECWTPEQSIQRGFSENPEQDIIEEMNKYPHIRLQDIVDEERNLVFTINY
jgi:FkbM family methyltransferase